MSRSSDIRRAGEGMVLWAGTTAPADLGQRLQAAATTGYPAISAGSFEFGPPDTALDEAMRCRDRAAMAGIRIACLDPIASWLPPRYGRDRADLRGKRREFADLFTAYPLSTCLQLASAVGATAVTLIEPWDVAVDPAIGAEYFAAACDLAIERGVFVQLEAMPFSGIPDLAAAWDIVQLADRANGRLVLDTWHFFRGSRDFDLLRVIPGERISSVQFSDGRASPAADLWLEAVHARLLPGDGDFDLPSLCAALHANADRLVGPEVVADAMATLGPEAAALVAAQRCREFVTGAG